MTERHRALVLLDPFAEEREEAYLDAIDAQEEAEMTADLQRALRAWDLFICAPEDDALAAYLIEDAGLDPRRIDRMILTPVLDPHQPLPEVPLGGVARRFDFGGLHPVDVVIRPRPS